MKTANQEVADEREVQCEKIVLKTENIQLKEKKKVKFDGINNKQTNK